MSASHATTDEEVAVPSSIGPGYLIRSANKAFSTALAGLLAEAGLALNHYFYLRALFEQDGLTPAELSDHTGMERPTVTAVLDTMERQELVRRAPHPRDRRKIQVFLTPKGEALRAPVLGCIARVNAAALVGVPPAEFARFQRTLATLTANVERPAAVRAAG